MSRLGITFEEVVDAAFSIQEKGEIPTIDKVRALLGSTGSNTTISKYLNMWRQKILPRSNEREDKVPPDVVQTAVQHVWKQMKEQADAGIEKIKNEAQGLIEASEQRAQTAETMFNDLKQEHAELKKHHQTQLAEKELLLLDLNNLREEHALLQERYKGLNERYIDMQGLASQHLEDLASSHKNEILHLKDKFKLQEDSHQKLIDEIKNQHKNERQQYMLSIDSLKVENQKSYKYISELEKNNKENNIKIAKLELNLSTSSNEHTEALKRIDQQDEKWSFFQNKTPIPDEILNKIYDMPKLELFLDKINFHFSESINKKFFEFKNEIKLFKFEKQVEMKDES